MTKVIKVLGTGCSSCKALFTTVQEAVKELGIDATVEKEEDLNKIMAYNVMSLPALVINDKVVSKGQKLTVEQVKQLLA
ncbi:MAG: thioredoxin family protein [Muribaculaceae bacterium]|nr:thioredoxin family protein [Muribaculaceae bacterium]